MPDTGYQSPSANENNVGVISPGNAYASDNSTADFDSADDERVDYYNFGFSIPTGSQIDGIEVSVEAASFLSGTPAQFELTPRYNGRASAANTQNTGNFGTTDSTLTVGGASDLWGRTWTVGDFSDANFSIRVQENAASGTVLMELDHIQVKVYYTEAGWTGTINGVTDP